MKVTKSSKPIVVSFIFFLLSCLFFLSTNFVFAADFFKSTLWTSKTISWKDIRDKDIEKQDLDVSCGSASTASILNSFYNKEIYEKDILKEIMKLNDKGIASFADIKTVVNQLDFKAIGAQISFEKLKDLKIPVLVYLNYRNQDHFSVFRGINSDELIWLGDPSWGNIKLSKHKFKKMWLIDDTNTGKILLIIPKDKKNTKLNKDFFATPRQNKVAIKLINIRD